MAMFVETVMLVLVVVVTSALVVCVNPPLYMYVLFEDHAEVDFLLVAPFCTAWGVYDKRVIVTEGAAHYG